VGERYIQVWAPDNGRVPLASIITIWGGGKLHCIGCQFVSESLLRSPGSCINHLLVLLPRILLMTVIFCLTLVVVRRGLIPTTSGSCSCHEHTTNLATGVSRQPVLDCGTIFHPDCGGRDFPLIPWDDLWKHISLATEAPIDSFDL